MEIISRDEAKIKQQKLFFTGKPCKHGHIACRYTSNNICVECQATSNQRHWGDNRVQLQKDHRDRLAQKRDEYNYNRRVKYHTDEDARGKAIASSSVWYEANRETVLADESRKAHVAQYYQEHKETIRSAHREWRELNRDHVNEQARQYRQNHRGYYNAKQAAYRAHKKLATPLWCEQEDIADLYDQALVLSRDTGIPHHVDHIVPLKHPKVCGLHCLANLRIITETENKRKSNKFTVNDD